MRVVVIVEGVPRVASPSDQGDAPAFAYAGLCPVCARALIVALGKRDADAICDACGAIVGRVLVHAHIDRRGNVVGGRA